jgi:hypothetical protein
VFIFAAAGNTVRKFSAFEATSLVADKCILLQINDSASGIHFTQIQRLKIIIYACLYMCGASERRQRLGTALPSDINTMDQELWLNAMHTCKLNKRELNTT